MQVFVELLDRNLYLKALLQNAPAAHKHERIEAHLQQVGRKGQVRRLKAAHFADDRLDFRQHGIGIGAHRDRGGGD